MYSVKSQNIIKHLRMWHTPRFQGYVQIKILTATFAILLFPLDFFKNG